MWHRAKHQIFNRILLMYSIIILFVLAVLILFVARFFADDLITRSLGANNEQLTVLSSYMSERDRALSTNLRELYFYPELVESISVALKNEPSTYLEYRLEQYALQRSFVPSNVESFMRSFYYSDDALDAIVLSSYETEQKYSYVFHYANWTRSQNKTEQDLLPITISRPINDGLSTSGIGQLTAYYNRDLLTQAIDLKGENQIGLVQIYSEDGELLFTNREENVKMPLDDAADPGYKEFVEDGERYYYKIQYDSERGFIYAGIVPYSDIKELSLLLYTGITLLVLIAVITVLVGYLVMRRYAKRINRIEASMLLVKNGDLSARIDLAKQNQKDELGTIALSFNRMLDELATYIDKSYVLELKNQEAEMRALQAQMNPHFLYNTLETIRMKAIIEGAKDAGAMTFHLASILRYALADSQQVTLNEELEHAKQYMALMQYRYTNKLKVSYFVDETLLQHEILRFTLQPLAENYMIHGFMADQEDNQLTIKIIEELSQLVIEVKDNGKGITSERLDAIHAKLDGLRGETGKSIGLANINKRLQLRYGKDFGVVVQSSEGHGTLITIHIPLEKAGGINHARIIG